LVEDAERPTKTLGDIDAPSLLLMVLLLFRGHPLGRCRTPRPDDDDGVVVVDESMVLGDNGSSSSSSSASSSSSSIPPP